MQHSKPVFQSTRSPHGILACAVVVLMTGSTVPDLPDTQVDGYVVASGVMQLNHAPTDATFPALRPAGRQLVFRIELVQPVTLVADQHHLHPALLPKGMKTESSFSPVMVSKAGAVDLMQLCLETAMPHAVRNLNKTDEDVARRARHRRCLLNRFHDNMRMALPANNAGERKVDRYWTIPP